MTRELSDKKEQNIFFHQETQGPYPATPLQIWQCNVLTDANMGDMRG